MSESNSIGNYDDYVVNTIIASPKLIKPTKIPVTQVFYSKKIVSVRGFKFQLDPNENKNIKSLNPVENIDTSEIVLKIANSEIKEANGNVAIIFSPTTNGTWDSKDKPGILSKFSKKVFKKAAKLRKRLKVKCSAYYCGRQKQKPVGLKMISSSVRYNSLNSGKVLKKKDQFYRHIWMPVAMDAVNDPPFGTMDLLRDFKGKI